MKTKNLLYNGRIHTMSGGLVVDSMAVAGNNIVAVGNRLKHDPDFKSYTRINLRGRMVCPGFVDAHVHLYQFALLFGQVSLDMADSLSTCLRKIRKYSSGLAGNTWVVGAGYSLDRLREKDEPDRLMLDDAAGNRPVFIFSKDAHTAWVSSRALEMAGIDSTTPNPDGGEIVRFTDGSPSGILREKPAYDPVYDKIPGPSRREKDRCYRKALDHIYRKGVTGVHSFDGPEAFPYFADLAEKGKLGIKINHYPSADLLPELERTGTCYGAGTDFFRIAGVKIFADGSLGSQSALCFNKYLGSKNNHGIKVIAPAKLKRFIRLAGKLNLPCAVHAIGDKAISNVLDAFENTRRPSGYARHRIEHLQLVRRKDLARVKRLGVVASMQPSHCPSDIELIRKYWGKRGRNAFLFRTVLDKKIDLAFGSDAPIEPLNPLAGIAAAVRRSRKGSRDVFYPEQRLTAGEALQAFTVGPAVAAGQVHCQGYLLPGYPADFVMLDQDITRIAPSRIYDTKVLATVIDGKVKYASGRLKL